jgi:hypothetical protein
MSIFSSGSLMKLVWIVGSELSGSKLSGSVAALSRLMVAVVVLSHTSHVFDIQDKFAVRL